MATVDAAAYLAAEGSLYFPSLVGRTPGTPFHSRGTASPVVAASALA